MRWRDGGEGGKAAATAAGISHTRPHHHVVRAIFQPRPFPPPRRRAKGSWPSNLPPARRGGDEEAGSFPAWKTPTHTPPLPRFDSASLLYPSSAARHDPLTYSADLSASRQRSGPSNRSLSLPRLLPHHGMNGASCTRGTLRSCTILDFAAHAVHRVLANEVVWTGFQAWGRASVCHRLGGKADTSMMKTSENT